MEDLKRSKERPNPSCQRKSSRSLYINFGRGAGEGSAAGSPIAAFGAAIGRASAVVTVTGPAALAKAESNVSAVKSGPACARGCTSGTRAALVALKLAAAFEAPVYAEEIFSCACTAQTPAQPNNNDSSSLFMIFPLKADPTPGIKPITTVNNPEPVCLWL
jgi:hypothetical protein